MSAETEKMDDLISDFAKTLEDIDEEVHGLASLAVTDEDGFMTRRTLIDPEIPEGVFIDIFASFFWVYVAEAGLDAEQTASLLDRILLTAVEPGGGEDGPAPAAQFRVMAQTFMDELQDRFGDVKSLVGIMWNDTLGDLICSTRCTEQLTAEDLSEAFAAFVVSLVASGQLTKDDARGVFARAGSRADEQYEGLQEYVKFVDQPRN
ncbi:MAG: hypothetical protein HDQ87_11900 [Clostridia bacterium]|nr:hypothetical protein [Clostridia bacterium]